MVELMKEAGLQIAGGVAFKLGEDAFDPPLTSKACTFRVGLFGIDKLRNIDECVARLEAALVASAAMRRTRGSSRL